MEEFSEKRPWGEFHVLVDKTQVKVKTLIVNPGQRLSLQSHLHRDEHWIVVAGTGELTLDGKHSQLSYGQHVFIQREAVHRVQCVGSTPLELIEVQTGTSFSETDITRYDDDYGRVPL